VINAILYGTGERIQLKNSPLGSSIDYMMSYEGISGKCFDVTALSFSIDGIESK